MLRFLNNMTRERKYLNLTDTDIDEIIESFEHIMNVADSSKFHNYINKYHKIDIQERGYDPLEIVAFCKQVYAFVSKKRIKLRVKTDLKLNKDNLFGLIFTDDDFELNPNIRFWIAILFEFCFSKHEIYDHLDSMEENYKNMYDKYLSDYDLGNMENIT